MGQPSRHKRTHKGIKDNNRLMKTKRRTKDIDQVHTDLKPENVHRYLKQELNVDLPGLGQYYCVETARYFQSQKDLDAHKKTKVYKNMKRRLKEVPYSHAEAEAAAGMAAADNGPRPNRTKTPTEQSARPSDPEYKAAGRQ